MRRELHALILTLVGGTLLKLAFTGDYARYVKPGVRPLLVAAAVVVLAIAAATLRRRDRRDHADGDGHAHRHSRFDVAWLLLLPMLVLLLLAPPALGSFSAARSGTALGAAPASDQPPLPEGDPVRLSMMDYASRAVYECHLTNEDMLDRYERLILNVMLHAERPIEIPAELRRAA